MNKILSRPNSAMRSRPNSAKVPTVDFNQPINRTIRFSLKKR